MTRVNVSLKNFVAINIMRHLIHYLKLQLGLLLISSQEFAENYTHAHIRQGKVRLTTREITALQRQEEEIVDSDYDARSALEIKDDLLVFPEKAAMYQKAALLCLPLISDHKLNIRTVVNVGARVDVVSSYLARRHPQVNFTSVDFQSNLAELNSLLPQSSNWSFVSGYALDLFENGKLLGDLVLFSSTSVLFTNKELRLYFNALSKVAKYIILNEGWWTSAKSLKLFRLLKPEDIDPYNSLVISGPYTNYLHNYPAILSEYGFEIVSSEIHEVPKRAYWCLQIIAKNSSIA